MNFIFISPHFPKTYYQFCQELKNNGVNVLGIASDHSIAKDDNKVRRTAIKSREKVAEKGIEAWKEVETLKAQQNERE